MSAAIASILRQNKNKAWEKKRMQTKEITDKYTRKLVSLCLSGKEESRIYFPVRQCLIKGADPNVRYKRRSIFSYLVYIGYCRLVALFIRFGANVNAKERKYGLYSGVTAVPITHLTVPGFQKEMVDELLEAGANVEAQDERGRTIVYKAVKLALDVNLNDAENISLEGANYITVLIRHGANMFRRDPESGLSPYELAENDGKESIITRLIERVKGRNLTGCNEFSLEMG